MLLLKKFEICHLKKPKKSPVPPQDSSSPRRLFGALHK